MFQNAIYFVNVQQLSLMCVMIIQGGTSQLVEFCTVWDLQMNEVTRTTGFNAAGVDSISDELAARRTSKFNNHSSSYSGTAHTFANPWWAEVIVLLQRSFKNIRRTPELFLMRMVTVLITGFLLATIFWHVDNTPTGVQVSHSNKNILLFQYL